MTTVITESEDALLFSCSQIQAAGQEQQMSTHRRKLSGDSYFRQSDRMARRVRMFSVTFLQFE